MNKEVKENADEEIDVKMLFAVSTWGFLLASLTYISMVSGITEMYKVSLLSLFLNNLFLCGIGVTAFKSVKVLGMKINWFLKIYIIITMGIYILTLGFIIINNSIINNDIYFKGEVVYLVLKISFANIISTIFLLLIISIKVLKARVKYNEKGSGIKATIVLCPIILSVIINLTFGYLGLLFSKPHEVEVINKNVEYIIRVEGFLVAKNESTFIYNKSINKFFMKRLNDNEVPSEILAENNGYY